MIRRLFGLLVLAGTLLVLLVSAPTVGAQTKCDIADATARAGQLDVAASLYSKLLDESPKPPCAVTGYAAVAGTQRQATSLVDEAATAEKLGDSTTAMAKVAQALHVDPSSAAARALLKEISKAPHDDPYAVAHALLAAGYGDDARTEARRVAKTATADTPEPIPPDLQAPTSWKKRSDDFVAAMGSYGAALGIFAGFIALAGLVLFQLFSWALGRHRPVSVEKLEAPDDMAPNADALTAMLIDEMGSGGSGRTLDVVRDAPGTPEFDVTAALGDKWKWIGALWRSLPVSRTLVVRGDVTLAGDGSHEARMILTISRRGTRVAAKRRFSAADPALEKADLLDLVMRDAAAWLVWQLVKLGAAKSRRGEKTDWQSWSRFRQGVWYGDHKRTDIERARYVEALGYDHDNCAAWLNLASLDRRDDYAIAIERLEIADRCLVDQWGSDRPIASPIWYRVKNVLCVALLNISCRPDAPEATAGPQRLAALAAATDLVCGLVQVRTSLIENRPLADGAPFRDLNSDEKDDLAALARSTEDTAIALLASSLAANGDLPSEHTPSFSDKAECWAKLANLRQHPLTADEVLGCLFCIHRDSRLNWIAEYNLACLYAHAYESSPTDDAYRVQALFHLRRGLEGLDDDTRPYARNDDPAFLPLRNGPHAEEFYKLIDSRGSKPPTTGPSIEGWTLTVPA